MAFRIAWKPTDRLTYQGISYTIVDWKKSKVHLRRFETPQIIETWDESTLEAVWDASNDFRYEPRFFSGTAGGAPTRIPSPTVTSLNVRDRDILLYRKAYVEAWMRLLAERPRKWFVTAPSALKAAEMLRPIVDGLGNYTVDPAHLIAGDDSRPYGKFKGRVGTPMPEADGTAQVEKLWFPSGWTLLDWFWKFRDSGGDPMSLKPEYWKCGFHGPHVDPEVEAIITKKLEFYLTTRRPSKKEYLEEVVKAVKAKNMERKAAGEEPLQIPGMGPIDSAINGLSPYFVMCKQYGEDYARLAYPWANEGIEVNVPGQRVEIDAYQADVMVLATWSGFWEGLNRKQRAALKKKRMWLTIAIDRATRCIVGMRLSDTPTVPDAVSVMEMVESDKTIYSKMAGTDKPWHHRCGIMGAVADGGYVSSEFRAALSDVRATLEFTKAGDPTMRGVVERIFRTVAVQLMARLNGKTFSDIFDRANYDSAANAGLTVDELAWILVTWVVDIYHNTPHEGLRGQTPNERWDEMSEIHGVHPWRDAHGRRSSFGIRLKRKIRERGFNVLGNWYRDDDPEGARGMYFNTHDDDREFEVAFDASNLGAISVIVDDVAITVPCRDPKMEGVCAEDWIGMTRKLREENELRTQFPRQIANQAMERILELNKTAHARSLIARKVYSKEQIDAEDNGLFKQVEFVDPAEAHPSDILGGSIEAMDLGSLPSFADLTDPDAAAPTDQIDDLATRTPNDSDEWTMDD